MSSSSPTSSSSLSSAMVTASRNDGNDDCLAHRSWFYFLLSSCASYLFGIELVIGSRILVFLSGALSAKDSRKLSASSRVTDIYTSLRWYCESLVTGQTWPGKIMVSVSCLLSIASLIIYLIDATNAVAAETCLPWRESSSQKLDLALNLFFLDYFLIRFAAATDKLAFLTEWNSFVDCMTVPPSFVGIALGRQWLGLRFLRAVGLTNIPDILQYLSILRSGTSIRIAQVITRFVSACLAAAGFIHLLELTGDPFENFANAQKLTYWESVYFVIVTMSTVGYGDIYCHTTLGRAFMTFFVFGALAMFAALVRYPLIEALRGRQRFASFYDKPVGVRHVVVCGHITYDSVSNFIRDFLHEDRLTKNVKCVFIDSKWPDLELEALFKRLFTQIVFIKGSIMNIHDLERVRLRDADACLILANQGSLEPDSEDAENIMRVISAKNCHPNIRVIVQLLGYHNKSFCVNLPSWTTLDQALCLSELKLGFMAVGCLAPGFSTLLANLFVMRSYKKSSRLSPWQDLYLHGTGLEVYSQPFSVAFHGLPFPEVNKICFIRLRVLLVAVTVTSSTTSSSPSSSSSSSSNDKCNSKVVLNPGHDVVIDDTTLGFFVCQSEDEARQVTYFCPRCHDDQQTPGVLERCLCKRIEKIASPDCSTLSLTSVGNNSGQHLSDNTQRRVKSSKWETTANQGPGDKITPRIGGGSRRIAWSSSSISSPLSHQQKTIETEDFDSTAHFHWSMKRTFKESLLSSESNREMLLELRDHIVVCCFGDEETPTVGLVNFLMPLRASNIRRHELVPIVLLGDEQLLEREWHHVSHFPLVYTHVGCPLNRSDLRRVRTDRCRMCVILTRSDPPKEDPLLVDKESILCSLNIKTMTFPLVLDPYADPQQVLQSPTPTSIPTNPSHRRSLILERGHEEISNEKKSLKVASKTRCAFLRSRRHRSTFIPMLTELANDLNAQFLDQDDEDDPDLPLYMTQPFACGRTFAVSVLDALMSTVFFNPSSLDLIRAFVTGGGQVVPRVDDGSFAADGSDELLPCQLSPPEVLEIRKRSRLTLLPLRGNDRLEPLADGNYGQLVVEAMSQFGILCLGLYRRHKGSRSFASSSAAAAADAASDDGDNGGFLKHRYVVTNPPPQLRLWPSDEVYCLEPFSC